MTDGGVIWILVPKYGLLLRLFSVIEIEAHTWWHPIYFLEPTEMYIAAVAMEKYQHDKNVLPQRLINVIEKKNHSLEAQAPVQNKFEKKTHH